MAEGIVPVEPRERIVLAIRIVVTLLGAANLIPHADHGRAVRKEKQGKKVPADLDDFDLEDEEEYLTEDEETEEKNE